MLYRVAFQINTVPPTWRWKSTPLSSLNTLLQWLQFYRTIPHDRLRIFSSCSREEMNEQLMQENQGLLSSSFTATQFLQERLLAPRGNELTPSIAIVSEPELRQNSKRGNVQNGGGTSTLEMRRLELESGAGADHDLPYHFTFPHMWPQARVWTELLVQVQRGELQV